LRERIISAIALVVLMVAIVVFNSSFRLALNIAITLVSVLGVYEIASALQITRNLILMIPSLMFAAAAPYLGVGTMRDIAFFLYTVAIFSGLVFYHADLTFREVGVMYSMTVMIPTSLCTIIYLRDFGGEHGMFYSIIAISSAWISDVGGFFAGRMFGKHKLCPEISPKKTVEGAFGSLGLNVFAMLLFGFLFQTYYGGTVGVSYLPLLIIGVCGTVISILGDLSFSLIKRSCHIKDFSEIIPGHGGILDRFDSVIFEAPFVYLLVHFLPIVK
jgi:phosphatidate cytidylyltransferase